MKYIRWFIQEFGTPIALLAIAYLSWKYVDLPLSESEQYASLFPLHWVFLLPFGEVVREFLVPYTEATWWIWAEIGVMFCVWTFLFFFFRGLYYFCLSLDGSSMWIAFVLCIALLLFFFYLIQKICYCLGASFTKFINRNIKPSE